MDRNRREYIQDSLSGAREDAARDGVSIEFILDATAREALAWLYPELAAPRPVKVSPPMSAEWQARWGVKKGR